MLEELSREIRSGYPEELLYTYDLAVVIKTLESMKERLEAWKGGLESKALTVNAKKTKVIIGG